MFLRLTCICFVLCAFGQVNSTFTFGTNAAQPGGGTSFLGDLLRRKAQFFDNVRHHIFPGAQTSGTISFTPGNGYINGNVHGGGPIPRPAGMPSNLIELITACLHHNYLDVNVAQNLGYVSGQPEYLFQYVNELGQIIPITREVAVVLVPNLGV